MCVESPKEHRNSPTKLLSQGLASRSYNLFMNLLNQLAPIMRWTEKVSSTAAEAVPNDYG